MKLSYIFMRYHGAEHESSFSVQESNLFEKVGINSRRKFCTVFWYVPRIYESHGLEFGTLRRGKKFFVSGEIVQDRAYRPAVLIIE